ncbi:MAG: YeeE/YedE family protein [Bacteroidetes bacterium]|nr:YeeE/YedE family protein [Bacteroidota bacterium]
MFPLVPDLISEELNLIVALLLGIAFGFILEQAGFSSSRRLAGLFYGYDFTVLRVFFTAGVTAMCGVLLLDFFGILDTNFIYINPTYLYPAILGGAIMGLGFVIGGYCPGTSVCAAAIGKIDAMVFVAGGLLGVYLFGEGYPLYHDFYTGSFLGNIRIFDSLGMSQGMFALLLIAMAVGAFYFTSKIEQKVNAEAESFTFNKKHHAIAGGSVLALGVALVFMPNHKERILSEVMKSDYIKNHPVKEMTSDELAFRILDKDPRLQIIDLRDTSEFNRMTLPGAVNIQRDQLFQKEFSNILGQSHKKKVFIANSEVDEREAALLSNEIGYENLYVLCDGVHDFVSAILTLQQPASKPKVCEFQVLFAGTNSKPMEQHPDARYIADTERFRAKASGEILTMIKEAKEKPVKKITLVKKVAGGC